MSDGLPPISTIVNDQGAPVVIVGDAQVTNAKELIEAAPALQKPEWIRVYANILNHMAHGYKYELIIDPDEFQAQYMKAYEAENPEEKAVAGLVRLHNYGIPEFSEIAAPTYEGETLTFFVRENYLGIPYKATLGSYFLPTYEPVTLTMEGDEQADE
ncbi:hypothetical protein OS190_11830 [Sulfitobacter sp. F26204]|uniref:hypothetical protein n=1 Tax=Sulfitobacter sp. F26204 TaxID=2996014 RepID=UPI00225E50C8|nr:hypothetical protein [Sulfitobacter sp. F26204]MCX7560260.1 hypothetical protein [Sulfitobacter sp. F26204]